MPRKSKAKAEEENKIEEVVAEEAEAEDEAAPEELEPTTEVETEAEAEVEVEAEAEVKAEAKKPARRRRSRAKKAEVSVDEAAYSGDTDSISIGAATMQKSMESVAKQWVVVREISQHVTAQLERVSRLLQDIPKEAIFNPVQKPNPLTKIAIGASAFAITLSLISLSMS